jgi:hypothetical protein
MKKNNLPRQQPPSANFLAPLPGRKEDFCEGSFCTHIIYFVLLFCFTLFILPALLYIKNQKKNRILGSCYFFTLVYYV